MIRNGTENTLKDYGGFLCRLGRVAEFERGLMRERTKSSRDAAEVRKSASDVLES
jgi:DNA invertase Pin-like site-specific DNA recombinase